MEKFSVSPLHQLGLALILCAGLACGCGGGPRTKPLDPAKQATISGKITLDGSMPVPAETTVVFACPELGATVAGKTNAQGEYTVTAGDRSIGIPAGTYKVMIRPAQAAASAAPPPTVGSKEYEKMMTTGGEVTKKGDTADVIPAKFHTFDGSKLALEIAPGKNTKDLDLSKL
jgi:hypothetical protein